MVIIRYIPLTAIFITTPGKEASQELGKQLKRSLGCESHLMGSFVLTLLPARMGFLWIFLSLICCLNFSDVIPTLLCKNEEETDGLFYIQLIEQKEKIGHKFLIKIFKRWQMARTDAMTVTWLSGLWIYFRSTSRSFVWEDPSETQTVYDSGRGCGPMMTP